MSEYRLFKVIRTDGQNYFDIEYVRGVVMCEECKFEPICSQSVQHTTRDAHSVTIGYKSVDFCSYGEREGE